MRRVAVMPSITGICTSMITRSKPRRSTAAQASAPSLDHLRAVAGHREVGREDLAVGRIVLGDEHPRRRQRRQRRGRRRRRPPPRPGGCRRRRAPRSGRCCRARARSRRRSRRPSARPAGARWRGRGRCRRARGSSALSTWAEALEQRGAWPPRRCRCRCRAPRPRAAPPSGVVAERATSTPPASVNFTALPTRFISTCRTALGVAEQACRHLGRDARTSPRRRGRARRPPSARPRRAPAGARRPARLDGDAVGLELGEVEDVVEDREQLVGRVARRSPPARAGPGRARRAASGRACR